MLRATIRCLTCEAKRRVSEEYVALQVRVFFAPFGAHQPLRSRSFFFVFFAVLNLAVIDIFMGQGNVHIHSHLISWCASLATAKRLFNSVNWWCSYSKEKGAVQNCVGIMLGRTDLTRSRLNELLCTQRASEVFPGEAGEGEPLGMAQVRILSVPMVAVENRPPVPVMDPRDYKVRRFFFRREVELSKCRFFHDCEGCRAA